MTKTALKKGRAASLTGYLHPGYAGSLFEFGRARPLRLCGGSVLERPIPGVSDRDAMGCYPLFCCRDWSQLLAELEQMGSELVCLSLVTDPFAAASEPYLRKCFPEVMIPFKEHLIADLRRRLETFVSAHHRRNAGKALRRLQAQRCEEPSRFLDDWVSLYSVLTELHGLRGIQAFSRRAFEAQLDVPGLVMFRAVHEDATVSMLLWYVQGNVAYYHLGASSRLGYELRASFALFWKALEHFASTEVSWLSLGAGAGIGSRRADGLARFKRGWSTGTRRVYFCGRVLDPARYSTLVSKRGIRGAGYFPAYRAGEFGSPQFDRCSSQ